MIKNMVRTSVPKNQEFHKHNEPQPKIWCSYKKSVYLMLFVWEGHGGNLWSTEQQYEWYIYYIIHVI